MAVNTGSAEQRELAAGLRKLREARGLTTRVLADASGQSAANISHWESGGRLPSEERLETVLDALDAPEQERMRLLGLRAMASGPGQLLPGAPSIGSQLTQLISYERVASRITEAALALVPGLLQTSDYARCTVERLSDIDLRVTLRTGRREILTRAKSPVEYTAYIDSEALVRPIGPPEVMADQLRWLLEMGRRPNVDIRIVPSTRRGFDPLLAGSFVVIEFPTAPPIAHIEHHKSSAFLWDEEDVRSYRAAVTDIQKKAMTSAQSAEAIAEIVTGWEKS